MNNSVYLFKRTEVVYFWEFSKDKTDTTIYITVFERRNIPFNIGDKFEELQYLGVGMVNEKKCAIIIKYPYFY